MPLAATGMLLTAAAARGEGVAAFDVLTLHHAHAVVRGAEAAGSPVIVQIGQEAVAHHDGRLVPPARAVAALAEASAVPVALHPHRVRGTALLALAASCRFSTVRYDSAHLSPARDPAVTRDIVRWAPEQNLWVEAAPRARGGGGGTESGRTYATTAADPEGARMYAATTGADALTVILDLPGKAALDHALLARLSAAVDLPLALDARAGTPPEELARAVAGGVTKVGFGTVLDAAMTAAVRARPAADAGPGDCLAASRRAMDATVTRLVTGLDSGVPADGHLAPSLT
jgi:fructose-bisphosphate aldolase class II